MQKDYDNSAMTRLIDERIHNELHRRVLKLRLIDGGHTNALLRTWTGRRVRFITSSRPQQSAFCEKIAYKCKKASCLLHCGQGAFFIS